MATRSPLGSIVCINASVLPSQTQDIRKLVSGKGAGPWGEFTNWTSVLVMATSFLEFPTIQVLARDDSPVTSSDRSATCDYHSSTRQLAR